MSMYDITQKNIPFNIFFFSQENDTDRFSYVLRKKIKTKRVKLTGKSLLSVEYIVS